MLFPTTTPTPCHRTHHAFTSPTTVLHKPAKRRSADIGRLQPTGVDGSDHRWLEPRESGRGLRFTRPSASRKAEGVHPQLATLSDVPQTCKLPGPFVARGRSESCGDAVHQPGNTLCVHSPPSLLEDSPALSSKSSFPEPTATAPLVAMGDATTRTPLVVRRLLVSVEEAAGLLGIGRTTLYELIRQGDVRPIRIGRCVRIPQRELEAYIDRLIAETWSEQ